MAEENLGRVLDGLSKAISLMCTNTDDLRNRWQKATESKLKGSWAKDFPAGELKEQYEALEPTFGKVPETEVEARTLIERLTDFEGLVRREYHRRHPES
jgi:hypothetical protein